MLLDRRGGFAQFTRVAAVGDRDHDIFGIDLAEAAVQRFGRVQKGRLGADRAEQTRRVARNVFRLADAGEMDTAAAAFGAANHIDRAPDLVEVDFALQHAQLIKAKLEKTADLERWIERTIGWGRRINNRHALTGHRFAKEREHLVTHLEAG